MRSCAELAIRKGWPTQRNGQNFVLSAVFELGQAIEFRADIGHAA
jgi:hypothetical protein